jgi:hypothetical protein
VKSIPPKRAAYLLDISRSVEVIQGYVAGQTSEQFLRDGKTQDAVLRRILVAGEAAARLTPETCAEFPDILFHKIVGSPTLESALRSPPAVIQRKSHVVFSRLAEFSLEVAISC